MKNVWNCVPGLSCGYRLVVCLIVASVVGCGGGPETGTVKGTVMLGDEPFGDASIVLVSMDSGQGGSTELAADGTFNIETELPVGSYKVYLTPKVNEEEMMAKMQQGMPTGVKMDSKLPQKYQNEASTDLTVQVEAGENDVTLTLNSR